MNNSEKEYTIAHITHEAVEKIGGIGTVLEGMITSPVYKSAVKRSILVGPMGGMHFESPMRRFGDSVSVLYSSKDEIDTAGWGRRFHPIERAFKTPIAYGTRFYKLTDGSGRQGEAEVLLIDVSHPNESLLNEFKGRLWSKFNIDAAHFQSDWGFEEYCRIAEPAFYAISAILPDQDLPCIIISHEFMGMCTALKTVLEGGQAFRTVFHAHECATARNLVEHHSGHDTAFYNIMKQAAAEGKFVNDVFGDQSKIMRHAIISQAHHLDGIIAVGDPTADELSFLSPEMKAARIDLVYNGIPSLPVDLKSKVASRQLMQTWAKNVTGRSFDILMTHVTRPVISKGLWRDFKVAAYMDEQLGQEGLTALFIILTCGAPPRHYADVNRMAKEYGWPDNHLMGYPDLVGLEQGLYDLVKAFNKGHKYVHTMIVNQFGWNRQVLGDSAPESMTFADLRIAADVEFGQSVYEPFGIAQLEPLACGAICVPSSVCGCASSYKHALERLGMNDNDVPNVIVADYTHLDEPETIARLMEMSKEHRDQIEEHVAQDVARRLLKALPRNDDHRRSLIETGQKMSMEMGWDVVLQEGMLPLFNRIVSTT